MTPFVHFRSWLRTGPPAERVMTAVAAAVLLALVAWASAPHPSGTTTLGAAPTSATTGGTGAQQPAGTAAGTTGATAPGTGALSGGTAGGSGAATRGGTAPGSSTGSGGSATTGLVTSTSTGGGSRADCGTPGATDQGVTATTVTVGIVVVDLGAASNALALPSAADQEKAHRAVIADLNAKGGLKCRTIVPRFYTDSTLDASSEHSLCLQMAQDKLFAVYNNLFNTTEQTCIAKQHLPNIWYTPPHTPDVRQYSPYIISWQPDFDRLIHEYIAGASALGYFTGMQKLGILQGSCWPDENTALRKELQAVGVDPSRASVFDYGCPVSPAAPSPQNDQAAALQFKRDGVTNVVNVAYGNDAYVASAADQQGYHPKFAKMEDASASGLESASQKPPKSWDGTLLVTTIQTGAPHTPNYVYNGPTRACTKLLAKAGLQAAYSNGLTSLLGIACVDGALMTAMAAHSPTLTRRGLAAGLAMAGQLDLPYPAGPIDVTDPGLPTGGQLARPGRWVASCECWHLTDTRWRSF